MLRNYLAAALRNLVRNRLYAAINIVGLAVGMAAALLAALYVHEELSYDRYIPGYDQTYFAAPRYTPAGRPEVIADSTPPGLAAALRTGYPQIERVARLAHENRLITTDQAETNEIVGWVDAEFFHLLPLPVIAGDASAAVTRPDGAVLTRSAARKYFGRDKPIGETLQVIRRQPMTVLAVIEDHPFSANLTTQIFLSGGAAFSALSRLDRQDPIYGVNVFTYLRLADRSGVSAIENDFPQLVRRLWKEVVESGELKVGLDLVPLSELHLYPNSVRSIKPYNSTWVVAAMAAAGLLVILIAIINFVNLMTARATRRAMEVGIRKAAGAARRNLMIQFLGEAVIYASLAFLLALALLELLLPTINASLQREMALSAWSVASWGLIAGSTLITGLLAGIYPALVLTRFRPAVVMSGKAARMAGSTRVRQGLTVLQFAVLIGLILSTFVIHRQTQYGLQDGLRLEHEHFVLFDWCRDSFPEKVMKVPGVIDAACVSYEALGLSDGGDFMKAPNGQRYLVHLGRVGFEFFKLHAIDILAGRDFSRDHPADVFKPEANGIRSSIILNESAIRRFGFPSAAAAIGEILIWPIGPESALELEIIGVVADFSIDLRSQSIPPKGYYIPGDDGYGAVSIKLDGRRMPESMQGVESIWKGMADGWPIAWRFLDDRIQELYEEVIRQQALILGLSVIALFIACLGVFGLSTFIAESRTREIGIRKAMGADRSRLVRMLLWDFSKPLLLANLLAWPAGYYVMNRWLEGFAYRIDLQLWMFAGASAIALAVALLTVFTHALLVARANPVAALRHE